MNTSQLQPLDESAWMGVTGSIVAQLTKTILCMQENSRGADLDRALQTLLSKLSSDANTFIGSLNEFCQAVAETCSCGGDVESIDPKKAITNDGICSPCCSCYSSESEELECESLDCVCDDASISTKVSKESDVEKACQVCIIEEEFTEVSTYSVDPVTNKLKISKVEEYSQFAKCTTMKNQAIQTCVCPDDENIKAEGDRIIQSIPIQETNKDGELKGNISKTRKSVEKKCCPCEEYENQSVIEGLNEKSSPRKCSCDQLPAETEKTSRKNSGATGNEQMSPRLSTSQSYPASKYSTSNEIMNTRFSLSESDRLPCTDSTCSGLDPSIFSKKGSKEGRNSLASPVLSTIKESASFGTKRISKEDQPCTASTCSGMGERQSPIKRKSKESRRNSYVSAETEQKPSMEMKRGSIDRSCTPSSCSVIGEKQSSIKRSSKGSHRNSYVSAGTEQKPSSEMRRASTERSCTPSSCSVIGEKQSSIKHGSKGSRRNSHVSASVETEQQQSTEIRRGSTDRSHASSRSSVIGERQSLSKRSSKESRRNSYVSTGAITEQEPPAEIRRTSAEGRRNSYVSTGAITEQEPSAEIRRTSKESRRNSYVSTEQEPSAEIRRTSTEQQCSPISSSVIEEQQSHSIKRGSKESQAASPTVSASIISKHSNKEDAEGELTSKRSSKERPASPSLALITERTSPIQIKHRDQKEGCSFTCCSCGEKKSSRTKRSSNNEKPTVETRSFACGTCQEQEPHKNCCVCTGTKSKSAGRYPSKQKVREERQILTSSTETESVSASTPDGKKRISKDAYTSLSTTALIEQGSDTDANIYGLPEFEAGHKSEEEQLIPPSSTSEEESLSPIEAMRRSQDRGSVSPSVQTKDERLLPPFETGEPVGTIRRSQDKESISPSGTTKDEEKQGETGYVSPVGSIRRSQDMAMISPSGTMKDARSFSPSSTGDTGYVSPVKTIRRSQDTASGTTKDEQYPSGEPEYVVPPGTIRRSQDTASGTTKDEQYPTGEPEYVAPPGTIRRSQDTASGTTKDEQYPIAESEYVSPIATIRRSQDKGSIPPSVQTKDEGLLPPSYTSETESVSPIATTRRSQDKASITPSVITKDEPPFLPYPTASMTKASEIKRPSREGRSGSFISSSGIPKPISPSYSKRMTDEERSSTYPPSGAEPVTTSKPSVIQGEITEETIRKSIESASLWKERTQGEPYETKRQIEEGRSTSRSLAGSAFKQEAMLPSEMKPKIKSDGPGSPYSSIFELESVSSAGSLLKAAQPILPSKRRSSEERHMLPSVTGARTASYEAKRGSKEFGSITDYSNLSPAGGPIETKRTSGEERVSRSLTGSIAQKGELGRFISPTSISSSVPTTSSRQQSKQQSIGSKISTKPISPVAGSSQRVSETQPGISSVTGAAQRLSDGQPRISPVTGTSQRVSGSQPRVSPFTSTAQRISRSQPRMSVREVLDQKRKSSAVQCVCPPKPVTVDQCICTSNSHNSTPPENDRVNTWVKRLSVTEQTLANLRAKIENFAAGMNESECKKILTPGWTRKTSERTPPPKQIHTRRECSPISGLNLHYNTSCSCSEDHEHLHPPRPASPLKFSACRPTCKRTTSPSVVKQLPLMPPQAIPIQPVTMNNPLRRFCKACHVNANNSCSCKPK